MILVLLCFIFIAINTQGQVTTNPTPTTTSVEQQLENITQNNDDVETEDDAYLQAMQQYTKHPINLNYADVIALKELQILSALQIENLLQYRRLFGNFINLYELQAIPTWDLQTIEKIRPYITTQANVDVVKNISNRLQGGESSLLIRATQTLEKSKGFLIDSSVATNFYPGSPQKILVRYKYNYKNILQYGVLAEKDAGEQFFKGGQKQGFDFYSAHIFIRKLGIIKALAIGDYVVNLGQGLTQWQSLAFKKGAEIVNVKRQSEVLRPYNSAGEINFHRGLGITFGKQNWEATLFASYKKIDANLIADTSQLQDDYISSLQTSGYHRTASEVADKNVQTQFAFGGNLSIKIKNVQIGINGIQYKFKLPLIKTADPYNLYALHGNSFGNYSSDYSYTYKNMHLFGEVAISNTGALAFVNGLLISLSSLVDMSLVYRNISPKYQSLYTSAFTENTLPTNEHGLFTGITIRPSTPWRIDGYVDIFSFPWLKYRTDAPTKGADYFLQATYKPNKILEIYTRYQINSKPINVNPDYVNTLPPVLTQSRQNWRTQISYKISSQSTVRSRVEAVWFDKKGTQSENGFLANMDYIFKPKMKPLSGNIRLQYFETDGYNSRLYAFENDVLFSYSIPVFYDKGYRFYLNINYDVNKKLSLWGRIAQTQYVGKNLIGSGLDEIKGNHKTEIKLQVMYNF